MRYAMMIEHLVVQRIDERELLGERRCGFALAGREIARHLPGKPRPPLRGAADHHRVGAGCSQRARRRRRSVRMSPLTTTGIATACFTARTAAQSARPS